MEVITLRKHAKMMLALITLLIISLSIVFYVLMRDYSGASSNKEPKYNIDIIVKAHGTWPDFWRIVEQGVDVAEKEFNVNCFVSGPETENDIDDQIELIKESIARKPHAIVLAAGDYNRLVPICKEITEAGIKLIIMDSDVNYDEKVTVVSTDNYEIGVKLANLVDKDKEGNSVIGVIGHVEGASTLVQRYEGFTNALYDPEKRLIGIKYCEGSGELAKQQALEMIKENPNLNCFVGLNETSALGISRALQETGNAGKITFIACDSSEQQIKFMEDGTVNAFVIQNPFNMGYLSIEATVASLNGEKVAPQIYTDSVVITKEDMYRPENEKLLFPFNESALFLNGYSVSKGVI